MQLHCPSPTALSSQPSNALETAETTFHQHVNGDGTIGVPTLDEGTQTTDRLSVVPVATSAAIYAVPASVTSDSDRREQPDRHR